MGFGTVTHGPYHDSAGKQTNPQTTDVLADTGEMETGIYEVRVLIGASAASTFNVQHRNAANGANASDAVLIRAAAGQTGEYVLKFAINNTSERVRVVPETNVTGDAEATVQAIRIA